MPSAKQPVRLPSWQHGCSAHSKHAPRKLHDFHRCLLPGHKFQLLKALSQSQELKQLRVRFFFKFFKIIYVQIIHVYFLSSSSSLDCQQRACCNWPEQSKECILISKHPSLGDVGNLQLIAQLAAGAAALGPITGYVKPSFLSHFWPPSSGEGTENEGVPSLNHYCCRYRSKHSSNYQGDTTGGFCRVARSQRPGARGPAMAGNANLLCLLETKSSGLAVSTLSTRGTLHSESKGHRGRLGPMLAKLHLAPSQSLPRRAIELACWQHWQLPIVMTLASIRQTKGRHQDQDLELCS